MVVEALREDAQDAGYGPRLLNVIADQASSAQISVVISSPIWGVHDVADGGVSRRRGRII
jgi:hypothetical protein